MGRRAGRRPVTYLAHVVPGLEGIAGDEIGMLEGTELLETRSHFDDRTSLLRFSSAAPPAELLHLMTVEDVFVLAAEGSKVPAGRSGLSVIRGCIEHSQIIEPAVSIAMQVRPRRKGRVTFRVISRKSGTHSYRRVDVQVTVERAVVQQFPAWRLVEDNAQLELWVSLIGQRLLAGIRLSDNEMRHRSYRRVSLPAALKPTIAHAMVKLSQPRADDVFLDPMCGSGTIVIERALAGRYHLLLGGDQEEEAVSATLENVGPRFKPIEIRRWDARHLPLDTASVSALVTNLPFGKQIGTPEEIRALYPALLAEWVRVVRTGGRMVLLTSERAVLRRALGRRPELRLQQELPIVVRGLPSAIFVLRREG